MAHMDWDFDSDNFVIACRDGNLDEAQRLYQQCPAILNVMSSLGCRGGCYSGLHEAAQNNQPKIVVWLLNHGADPFQTSTFGKTALNFASDCGHDHIIEILRNATQKPSQGKKPKERHPGIACDRCNEFPIRSIRYKVAAQRNIAAPLGLF